MLHTVRRAFGALPLGLLLAGCGPDRAEFHSTSTAVLPARTTAEGTARGSDHRDSSTGDAQPAPRPGGLVSHVVPADPRYGITLDEMREHVRSQTAVIIDARGPLEFVLGHVRGAFNMPAGEKEAYMPQISQTVAPGQLIIIYCNGPRCNSSDMVYEYLVPQGFTNMRVFEPGWGALASVRDLR